MDRKVDKWIIYKLCRDESLIDVCPDYQRGDAWNRTQQQYLIDTIIRGMDIPKFYLRKMNDDQYEVVDGQQRIKSILQFRNNEYKLRSDCDPVKGIRVAGMKYHQLPSRVKDSFDDYPLDVVILSEASDEEAEDFFVRIQNGTPLNAPEKRNALPGNMKNFIRELVAHPFFEVVAFRNARYAHDHVAAQITCLELAGEVCSIINTELEKMYKEYLDFDKNSKKAKKIYRTLNYLSSVFLNKTKELEKYNVISLYLLISELLNTFSIHGREAEIYDWFINFESVRRIERDLPSEQRDGELIEYLEKISHATDSPASLEFRQRVLSSSLHQAIPDLAPLDERRDFTTSQRLAIYRRDKETCQLCGEKVSWDDGLHADHITPYSRGGRTIIENGQVLCSDCNLKKGSSILE